MDAEAYRTGYGLRIPFFAVTYAQVQTGVELGYHRVIQTVRDRRFEGVTAMAGDVEVPGTRVAKSAVFEAGLPLEAEFYFPKRIWLGVSAAGIVYRYRRQRSGQEAYTWAIHPGIALGHQF